MLQADQLRLRSLITESIVLLCKTGLACKSEFCVEGLLGITIDNTDVLLINIKETVVSPVLEVTDPSGKCCDDLSQGLPFSFLCKDDIIKVDSDDPILIDGCSDMVLPCSGSISNGSDSKTNRSLEDNLNQNIVDIANTYVKYEDFDEDEPHSTLLTCIELEELIDKVNKAKDLPFDSGCDQVSYDGGGGGLLKKAKLLLSSDDSNESRTGAAADVLTNHLTDVMLQNARDIDQNASGSEWDAIADEVVPLNLAGPQDLSTGISKQAFVCQSCGKVCKSENRLQHHRCEAAIDSDESLLLADMPEPLNLKSQPLDLTTGRVDGEPYMYSDLMMDQDVFICLCSRSYPDYQSYIDHSAVCSKAKLTPYKSCEICGKFLFSNSGYTKHKKLHVGEYKFHCGVCHKGFFDKTHLRAHTDSSHSKVRRHACPCCKKSFFWKHHLKRHLRTCTKEEAGAASTVTEDAESTASDVTGTEIQLDT